MATASATTPTCSRTTLPSPADSDGDGVGDNADLYPDDADNGRFRARASSTLIVFDDGLVEQAWHVNPDNNSVSAFDMNGARVAEIAVGQAPWALAKAPLADEVWVANKDDASLSVIDTLTRQVTRTIALPRGSQPHGLVFGPDSDDLYVVLEATGELRHYNAETGNLVAQADVGHRPRHVSVTADGAELLVTRFITPPLAGESTNVVDTTSGGGELMIVDAASLSISDTIVLAHVDRAVSENRGPGLPNYLGAPVIAPDGDTTFVPSKQDNLSTGAQRGGVPGALTFDQSVRAVSSIVDLSAGTEATNSRIDHDNASVASAAALTGDGRYLFVSLETSREVAVIDTQGYVERLRIPVGRAPQGVAVSARGRQLVVHNFMDRTAQFVALDTLVNAGTPDVTTTATTASVGSERLSPSVLLGKQLFYDASDDRLARDNYMSCASCHNDGDSDGRTWDFGQFGEGLRNTPTLRGHGVGHGLLHHSGNFDEVQDFENQIRGFAGGSGLMSNADFAATEALLGSPKAGRSADLDALAAYVSSLDEHPANPYRDGALSSAAEDGEQIARNAGCAGCHSGLVFTDSATGVRHDIGTLTAASGERSGAPLDGLDTPTLLGAWLTPPYLHDGSAPTLEDAVSAHDGLGLSAGEIASVAAWLREVDSGDSLDDTVPPGCVDCIDFSVTETVSYSNQDVSANVAVEDGGTTLRLLDNTWRITNQTYEVSPNTVLEFEFAGSNEGEIHGIGVDDNNSHEGSRLFRLWGTQAWGRADYDNYPGGGEFRRYTIPIGQHFTGSALRLFFVNDNDAGNGNDSRFRNVRFYDAEPAGTCEDCLDFTAVTTTSFSNQDRDQGVQVVDGGAGLRLSGNTWRRTNQRFDVTARTVIEFDFTGTVEGEIHGIGFDEDNTHTGNRIFKVHGTQTWGQLGFDNYVAGSGPKRYRIPVGSFYTGSDMAMIFVNDRDSGTGAEASFANVRVFEE